MPFVQDIAKRVGRQASSGAVTTNTDRVPPSITDEEPKDAYQLLSSGSDTD